MNMDLSSVHWMQKLITSLCDKSRSRRMTLRFDGKHKCISHEAAVKSQIWKLNSDETNSGY